ncbi:hypothetical protein YTPLAS18_02020 [Nitrospira sp.]|nr:hypothetical protein YTPLAS18_02020 [Nitrospira sp.]
MVKPNRSGSITSSDDLFAPIYEEIFRRAQEAIALLDADGRYIEQNQAHVLLFGFADRELVGQTPAQQFGESVFLPIMQDLMRAGHYRGEVVSSTKSGKPLALEVTAYSIAGLEPSGRQWVWICRDITPSRRVEEALRISQQVVEATPSPILVVGPDDRCRWVNPAFRILFRLMERDIVGRPLRDVPGLGNFIHHVRAALDRCLTGEESTQDGWVDCSSAERRYLTCTHTPLRATSGVIEGAAIIVRDVTPLKLASEAHNRRAEQLRMQQAALFTLAKDEAVQNGYLGDAFRAITESAAHTLDVGRVAVWMFAEERGMLELRDLYEMESGRHTSGHRVSAEDHPTLLDALDQEEVALEVSDVRTSPRTLGLTASYFFPLGIGAVLHAPIRLNGHLVGVLAHEHVGEPRHWTVEEQTFAGSMATLVTLALEARQVRQSEARFRHLVEEAPIGICMYGARHHVLRINRAFGALLGYQEADLIGQPADRFVYADDQAAHAALLDQGSRGERLQNRVDVRYVRRTGEELWVAVTARSITIPESNHPVLLTIAQDITGQHHAETLLRQSNEALEARVRERTAELDRANHQLQAHIEETQRAEQAARSSEERFRQLSQYVQDVFWLADVNKQQMLYVSPAYERIWGRSCDSLYASPQEWLKAIHPEDRARVRKAASNKQITGEYDEKYRIQRPDGSLRWIRDRAFPIVGDRGAVERVAGVAEDITEYQQLEQQVRQAAKMEALGRLAGGVAHDFNNLLTVIRGYCSFLLRSSPEDSTDRKYVEEIQHAADRGADLSQQLLLFSRGQAVKPKVVDLNSIIHKMLEMLKRVLGEDVQIHTMLGTDLWSIRLDPGQLEQVIVNLVANARDAMTEGGQLFIETQNVGAAPGFGGGAVRLAVRDTGCGMDEATKAHLFEPFFTTKKAGKGTGLGLALVHGVVMKSDGKIIVESAPGEGTSFMIDFPRHEAQAPVEKETSPKPGPMGSETILLVEDAATVRQLLREVLRSAGYSILEASDGVEALEQMTGYDGPIHLVITDVVMPRMNGRQLMDQVRHVRPQTLFLFMSGYMSDKVGRQGLDAPFIQKPFLPSDLLRAVRRVLSSAPESERSPLHE